MNYKIIKTKRLILGIICLFFFIFFSLLVFYYISHLRLTELLYKKVVFSNTKYPEEQLKVIKFLADIYNAEYFCTKKVHFKNKARNKTYIDDIYISFVDINNDKILDVISYIRSDFFIGSHGGVTLFFIIDKQGNWKKVLEASTYGNILVFNNSHKGYHDIGFSIFDKYNSKKEKISIWIWNGEKYI